MEDFNRLAKRLIQSGVIPPFSTAAQLRELIDNTTAVSPAAVAAAMATVTETAPTTYTPNFAQGAHRWVSMIRNVTFAQYSGITDGQTLVLYFVQDTTGSRSLSFGTSRGHYFSENKMPTLSTAAGSVDRLVGHVVSVSGVLRINWGTLEKNFVTVLTP